MADNTVPVVPTRNNRRLSHLKTDLRARITPTEALSDDLIDVWEHAVTLFQGCEWQDAAESFLYLSRTIEHELYSTSCLINAAIVFAKLGDYSTASHVLEDAMPVDELLALTLFVTGHIEYQLDELEKCQDCFTVALSAMKNPVEDYHRFGLEFTLTVSQIQDNLWTCNHAMAGHPGALTSLPAECIFRAPARVADPLTPASKRSSSADSAHMPALSEGTATPPQTPLSGVEKTMEYGPDGLTWHTQEDGSMVVAEDDAPPLPFKKPSTVQIIGGLTRRLSTQRRPPSPSKPTGIPPRRNRRALSPRDARVQGDSIQELAEYISDLPRQNQMDPRSAEAEHEDVGELASFLRAGPRPQPLNIPSKLASQQIAPGSASSSLYSRPASIQSADLLPWDTMSTRSSSPSPYRYRSGVGSYLAHGRVPTSAPRSRASSRSPLSREVDSTPAHEQPSKSLHPPMHDPTSGNSWPLAPGIAESLSSMSLSREGSIKSLPKELKSFSPSNFIPKRKSSLIRPAFSRTRPGSSGASISSKKPAPSILSNGTKDSVGGAFRFLNGMGHG